MLQFDKVFILTMAHYKIAISITGASGSIYAQRLLDILVTYADIELAMVMSKNAEDVWKWELGNEDYNHYSIRRFESNDFMAPFASGSAGYDALIICPCSMGTIGRIASGVSDSLTTRAADVMLKERRKLICVARETPYNLIHLQNMTELTRAGAIICPATPSFYSKPQSIIEAVDTVVHRVISLAGLNHNGYQWGK